MTAYTAKNLILFRTLFKLSVLALFVSFFAQIIITNRLALKSSELLELQQKRSVLEKEITSLQFEDSRLSALSYVENQATQKGFVKMTEGVIAIKDPTTAAAVSLR